MCEDERTCYTEDDRCPMAFSEVTQRPPCTALLLLLLSHFL